MTSTPTYQVVDLFAGPGGLAEGFASLEAGGTRPFRIALSVEKDPVAHRTLRFRAFLRQFTDGYPDLYYQFMNGEIDEPDWQGIFPAEWEAAGKEAVVLELGGEGTAEKLEPLVDAIRSESSGRTVVIGGPPCQAYSIVGRARNKGKAGYRPATDERHFLYREYIAILERIRPAAFVMENVKGILSSSVDGKAIFTQVLDDLRAIGGETRAYELLALVRLVDGSIGLLPTVEPKDFIICAERFGIPQARHRVIIVGVRRDAVVPGMLFQHAALGATQGNEAEGLSKATVRHVLTGLPALRSGLSRDDSEERWREELRLACGVVASAVADGGDALRKVGAAILKLQEGYGAGEHHRFRSGAETGGLHPDCPPMLRDWLLDPRLTRVSGHDSRSHMPTDLARYLFVAAFAEVHGRSPVAKEFPAALAPKHKNWDSGNFADRFRAQVWDAPSTTVTSHIAKDGHYFIHPDPAQCRALTVREAARLQTFPDNYRFLGNRTQQFVQVGNAVPPLLARQIADALHMLLSASGKARETASPIDPPTAALQQVAPKDVIGAREMVAASADHVPSEDIRTAADRRQQRELPRERIREGVDGNSVYERRLERRFR